jgi:hypothetical protein
MTVMSGVSSAGLHKTQDLTNLAEAYRRLAIMDPPAMRSLLDELSRISMESSASAAQLRTPEARTRAGRDAQRADDAQAALDSLQAQDSTKDRS